jgi:peptidoglycan/xylan/chitin deacetylase (PgdA/CDA1 family)
VNRTGLDSGGDESLCQGQRSLNVLQRTKIALLTLSRGAGLVDLCLESSWRQNRLLILCYHGTSLADEHLWDPALYIDRQLLRRRLLYLRQKQCSVIPLAEALHRLYDGSLPPRSVVLTYDDGTYDFYKVALPVIREFNYPVTVFLTTYYSEHSLPVFNGMCSYLLWKARGRVLDFPEVFPGSTTLTEQSRIQAEEAILRFAARNHLSGAERDRLLGRLAKALNIDDGAIRKMRLLHLMSPDEAGQAARAGVDIQLHTHRHRVYDSRAAFQAEVEENRQRIESITARPADHFCYPSGCHLPEFPQWLREIGVVSACTTRAGMATRSGDPLLLPRLVDTSRLSTAEFAAWISGLASVLPQRKRKFTGASLIRTKMDVSVELPS